MHHSVIGDDMICISMAQLGREILDDRNFPLSSSRSLFHMVAFIYNSAAAFIIISESVSMQQICIWTCIYGASMLL